MILLFGLLGEFQLKGYSLCCQSCLVAVYSVAWSCFEESRS